MAARAHFDRQIFRDVRSASERHTERGMLNLVGIKTVKRSQRHGRRF